MRRVVKRELSSSRGNRDDAAEKLRAAKRERVNGNRVDREYGESTDPSEKDPIDRRVIRSEYAAIVNLINEKKEDLAREDSKKFSLIMNEVERLHELVQKPREQVADAEALLDLAQALATSVKSTIHGGVTPSQFVQSVISEFGKSSRASTSREGGHSNVDWKQIGLSVSSLFMTVDGCRTMLGPMNTELKQRKTVAHRKHARTTESARPEELKYTTGEEKTDTDRNMATMFEILRKRKHVRLESLMLNRKSFAQTVENLFALSFLVKDGRAEITIDELGSHYVSPRNAPAASCVMSREVSYNHFVFRFDYEDWKLMMDNVPVEEDLMPHRDEPSSVPACQAEAGACESQSVLPTTPIRKLSRNRGRVVLDESIVEESPNSENDPNVIGIRRCRRKLN